MLHAMDTRLAPLDAQRFVNTYGNIVTTPSDLEQRAPELNQYVQVSHILYSPDSERTPRNILRLYNCMWLHHEMCTELILNPQEISQAKMFGSYLHDFSSHAAQQYEIVCLRSVNAECQERLFGQVKRTTLNATNRRPQQVIPEVLLRLQMRQKQGPFSDSKGFKGNKGS